MRTEARAWSPEDQALLDLLGELDGADYRFVTPTPETHRHFLQSRPGRLASDARDALGWSLPFLPRAVGPRLMGLLERAGAISEAGQALRCAFRVSSLGGSLFLHSAYPAKGSDAVFFGPDSYRFAAFMESELTAQPGAGRLVEIGAGAGPGAVVASRFRAGFSVTVTDVNPVALRLARINAAHAGIDLETKQGSGLDPVDGPLDLIVANPPYIAGETGDTYSEGGDMLGARLSLEWSRSAMDKLGPGGRFLLYTGSAIVGGKDLFREALAAEVGRRGLALRYRELDVDIFGEELAKPAYAEVERIAAIGAVIEVN